MPSHVDDKTSPNQFALLASVRCMKYSEISPIETLGIVQYLLKWLFEVQRNLLQHPCGRILFYSTVGWVYTASKWSEWSASLETIQVAHIVQDTHISPQIMLDISHQIPIQVEMPPSILRDILRLLQIAHIDMTGIHCTEVIHHAFPV